MAHKFPVPLRIGIVLAVLVVAGILIANRRADPNGEIRASGMIEMDEIDVASLVGGRVVRLLVDEGDSVHAGDTLAVLDRGEVSEAFRAQAAQAERATAQALEVRRGPRDEQVRMARADLAEANAELQLAEKDLARAETLARNQVIAQAELDRARSTRDRTAARWAAAAEALRIQEEGNRREQVTASREAAEAAQAELRGAMSRLRELVLIAPISGVVLLRNFESGELAQPGQPVVTLGNPDSLWMRVFVAAPEIERVKLGARADVRLGGISKQVYSGRVVEIETRSEFTPRAALTEEERANIVFGVKVVLDPSNRALKAGLPADVRIAPPRKNGGA
ncbi:MAG TPA: HlyD family efflux transporter periplasmic adaptor subunit [Candidatus Limnocylindria bacterium]|nr:HlyD family efflux transporter periplasmic adaptor subunit [Candidatus Limnocylindria bacterium]